MAERSEAQSAKRENNFQKFRYESKKKHEMLFHVKFFRKLGFLTRLTKNDSEHVFVWPRSLLSSFDRNPLRQLNDNISRNELLTGGSRLK